jgi:hypothetical protein
MPSFDGGFSKRIKVPWIADASGNASVAVSGVNGMLLGAEFVNGSGGSQPTNGYSATLKNDNGTDLFSGQATNISNSTSTPTTLVGGCPIKDGTTVGTLPWLVFGDLTLAIGGAGNGKSGTVFLYLR